MATYYKRQGKRGVRWTVRVRVMGRERTKTFATKGQAETWARAQERAIESGEFTAPEAGKGPILADVIDDFNLHRARIKRSPGQSFANGLERLKKDHGLEPLGTLSVAFWRKLALDRIAAGAQGSTVAADLAYAGSVLRYAAAEGNRVDFAAPGLARKKLKDDGVQVVSRHRTRRITDAELTKLFEWIDANAHRTSIPLRDLVEFALCTGLRRGEILALKHENISGRVITIKRKHPVDRERMEEAPLLKVNAVWPWYDPLEIIKRQPTKKGRIFPYLGDTVGYWFEEATKGAKIKGVVFHLLRHECLSRLAQRGFDPLRLALIGGHRDLRNVKRYAKLDAARLANE